MYTQMEVHYSSPQITLDYPNFSEARFYYEYHYNLQDGGSLVALWQLQPAATCCFLV